MAITERLTCFFLVNKEIKIHSIELEFDIDNKAKAIQSIIESFNYNPFNLMFVVDGLTLTYKAEYLHTLNSFQAEEELMHGNDY